VPSFILIRPTVWPQCTNVTDRQDRTDNGLIERTILQTVAQKTPNSKRYLTSHSEMVSRCSSWNVACPMRWCVVLLKDKLSCHACNVLDGS